MKDQFFLLQNGSLHPIPNDLLTRRIMRDVLLFVSGILLGHIWAAVQNVEALMHSW